MGNGPRNFHKTIVCLTFPPRSVKRRAAMGSAKSENQKAQRYVKDRSYSNPKTGDKCSTVRKVALVLKEPHYAVWYARIAVRGVRRIQLVGAADPLHLGAAVNCIADRKQIITGDAKAVADTPLRRGT